MTPEMLRAMQTYGNNLFTKYITLLIHPALWRCHTNSLVWHAEQ